VDLNLRTIESIFRKSQDHLDEARRLQEELQRLQIEREIERAQTQETLRTVIDFASLCRTSITQIYQSILSEFSGTLTKRQVRATSKCLQAWRLHRVHVQASCEHAAYLFVIRRRERLREYFQIFKCYTVDKPSVRTTAQDSVNPGAGSTPKKLHSNEGGASNGAPFVANVSPEPIDQQMVIVDTKLDLDLTRCPGKKSGMRGHNTAYPELSMGLQLNTVSTAEFPTYPQVYEAHLKLRQAIVGNRARPLPSQLCFVKDGKEEVEKCPMQSPRMARFRELLRLYRVQEGWGQGMAGMPVKHDGYESSLYDDRVQTTRHSRTHNPLEQAVWPGFYRCPQAALPEAPLPLRSSVTSKLVSVRKDDEGMQHIAAAASQFPLHLSHLKVAQEEEAGKRTREERGTGKSASRCSRQQLHLLPSANFVSPKTPKSIGGSASKYRSRAAHKTQELKIDARAPLRALTPNALHRRTSLETV
jgi:hypothetical protein